MRRRYRWMCLMLGWGLAVSPVAAQSYSQLWEKVETLQKEDLPQSQLKVLGEICRKAEAEGNLPEMMKAFCMRGYIQGELTPDSIPVERKKLKEWAARETDTVGQAVLNSLLGTVYAADAEKDFGEVVAYFDRSLQPVEVLGNTSAGTFRPMTESGEWSVTYFGDNFYDLLVRQAIRALSSRRDFFSRQEVADKCMELYRNLAGFYTERNDRQALLLTELAMLQFRYERASVWKQYRLPQEELMNRLWQLTDTFAGVPVCADVYVKLAYYYQQHTELLRAMQVVEEGLRKYPDGEAAQALRSLKKAISAPQLRTEIPCVYPGYAADVKVRYANLKGFRFEAYRLNLSPAEDARLWKRGEYEKLLRTAGKKVSSTHFALAPTPDYQAADTVLHYTLPEAGIYLLKLVPDGTEEGISYTPLFVSPYQLLTLPVSYTERELIAVNRMSGKPLAGVEIATYVRGDKENYQPYQVWKTDASGSVVVRFPDNRTLYGNVRTAGNDFMYLSPLRNSGGWVSAGETELRKETASLFTDRALYRPGQTVFVSGICYGQSGDEVKVLSGVRQQLRLYADGKTLRECEVATDEYGVWSAELVLPEDLMPGHYYLSCMNASRMIQVEEYKRPTFEVVFKPYEKAYAAGDSVVLQATARTFAGAPVRTATVRYRITRSDMTWFRGPASSEEEIASGELTTDADGAFTLPFCLTPSGRAEQERGLFGYQVYRAEATVTSGSGETRQGEYSLPLGKQSLGLEIHGLEERGRSGAVVLREKGTTLEFQALNLNRQPVSVEVVYRVYALDRQGKKVRTVQEGKSVSGTSFTPGWMRQLSSGKYLLEVEAVDEQGRKVSESKSFCLFSENDRQLPVDTVAWFYPDGNTFEASRPARIFVGTSEREVYLLMDVYSGDRRIDSQRIWLNGEMKCLSFPYRKEYGDGITVSLAFFRKNELYVSQHSITRPEPDKGLEVKWEVFRDRLTPGSLEEWVLRVSDRSGKPVRANVMATLYDASLDRLKQHDWYFNLYFPRRVPYVYTGSSYEYQRMWLSAEFPYILVTNGMDLLNGKYSRLVDLRPNWYYGEQVLYSREESAPAVEVNYQPGMNRMYKAASGAVEMKDAVLMENGVVADAGTGEAAPAFPLRENFAETAFFYPNLHTDSLGRVSLKFQVPDALTEWRFLGLAHTKVLDYGLCKDKSVASKPFMVQPNLPRFVRKGDETVLVASLVNLSMEEVAGQARICLYDPVTEKPVYEAAQPFTVGESQTGTVSFRCRIPEEYEVLVCRMTAEAGAFSDGEQHYLPVLSARQWVTETRPLQLREEGDTVIQTGVWADGGSRTASGHRLTLELTANPQWYVVQALPVLGNPLEEDAFSWAAAYYAQRVAAGICERNPRIRKVVEMWNTQPDSPELWWSRLEQNQEVKNLLLRETPWLAEAAGEQEQKRRLKSLFDLNRMAQQERTLVGKLAALQLADGSWGWYQGMSGSRYMTTQVVELLARLRTMQLDLAPEVEPMYRKALGYLKAEVQKQYDDLKRNEKKYDRKQVNLGDQTVRYLYICAVDDLARRQADAAVNRYLTEFLKQRSARYTLYEKALIAQILAQAGERKEADVLVRSIKEYLVRTPEMGSYFDSPKAPSSWNSYRIPTQVAAMEAICRLAPDEQLLNDMKLWLLKQKQTQVWDTPIATADAVYAFLCFGSNPLEESGSLEAVADGKVIRTPEDALGYAKESWSGKKEIPETVTLTHRGSQTAWAALYLQYQEDMDRIRPAAGKGLTIRRTFLKAGKPVEETEEWKVGDRLTVRFTLQTDRNMDFVQVRDERPACMEPLQQLSGYRWGKGIGYYQVNRDAASCFFIDYLPKGTYTIEYEVSVDRAGTYRMGTASVQSAYAPEFESHTEGGTMTVR